MSFNHEVTFKCDACETNFMIDESMEMPPGWLGMQVAIADSDGCVPDHEQDVFCHFCSQDCFVEFASSDEMRSRLAMADSIIEEDSGSDDGEM